MKVKGEWYYLYRAVDKCGDTVDGRYALNRGIVKKMEQTALFLVISALMRKKDRFVLST